MEVYNGCFLTKSISIVILKLKRSNVKLLLSYIHKLSICNHQSLRHLSCTKLEKYDVQASAIVNPDQNDSLEVSTISPIR